MLTLELELIDDMNKNNSISQLILNKLNEIGDVTLDSVFPKNKAESRIWRRFLGLPESYEFSPRSFSTILSRLRQDGLVVKSKNSGRFLWALSAKAKNRVVELKFPIEPVKPDGIPRLVMYDIPENQKNKRYELRTNLVSLGYQQLQKSVWLGYAPLPEEFMRLIKNYGLGDKVQIVSIDKKGTVII